MISCFYFRLVNEIYVKVSSVSVDPLVSYLMMSILFPETKEFVENLFEALENKAYITEAKTEVERTPTQDEKTGDETPIVSETTSDVTNQPADTEPSSTEQPLVTSTSKSDLKKDEVNVT